MINKLYICVIFTLLINFSLEYENNEDSITDYGAIKQFLQANQRSINKKNEDISNDQYSQSNRKASSTQLRDDYRHVDNWPVTNKKFGPVSAVALDVYKNVVVFHRGDRIWNSDTFDKKNNFRQRSLGAIKENTIVKLDRETGNVLSEWGSNLFYMPHGLHINGNFYYVTDVALHQVFRFNIKNTTRPDLVLGEAFKPSMTSKTFCKPTSVAQLETGDFFVADGYCNSRIVKFNFHGVKILEWGRSSFSGETLYSPEPPYAFAIPHALTLVPFKELLCVADRENGRIQCFNWTNGTFYSQYHSKIAGDRLFSVDYANNSLFVVNGPVNIDNKDVAGYIFDMDTTDVSGKFGSFLDPHDIAVTNDAREIYVGDLSADKTGNRIHKYTLNGIKPMITREGDLSNSATITKQPMRRGETALIVGSIVLLFAVFTAGIAILISKRKRRGRKIVGSIKFPWERADSKKLFYNEYNQFEKLSQTDDSTSDNLNEYT